MDKLFFFVTNSQAWKDTREFHENFFVTHNAFMYGVLTAIIVALVLALVFYFGCCNKRNDDSMQTQVFGQDSFWLQDCLFF